MRELEDYVPDYWSHSPERLVAAMEECRPLAWVVYSSYSDFRSALEAELKEAEAIGSKDKSVCIALKERLDALPEEPEDGAVEWLLSLAPKDFEERIVNEINKWLGEPPDWNWESDYLPESSTAQGAALEFFQRLGVNDLDTLGVVVVEGDHPGSTYFAAELLGDVDEANRAAKAAGIPVHFVSEMD